MGFDFYLFTNQQNSKINFPFKCSIENQKPNNLYDINIP